MNAILSDDAIRAAIRAAVRQADREQQDRARRVAPDGAPAAVAHPTDAWGQHHEAENRTGASGKRRLTRVERLADQGRIDHDAEDACGFFLSDWERAEGSGRGGGSMGERVDGGSTLPGAEGRVLEAMTRLREARGAVGANAARLLEWSVCFDLSWVDIGGKLKINHETARDWAVAAIELLSEHYRRAGRFGKPVRHTIRAT